jgi:hypothetical protein
VLAASATLLISAGLLTAAGPAQGATAVPLGTAGTFAILGGSGITNTLATTISGDVGSSPTSSQTGFGACPGFADCVTLTGGNHVDPDPNDAATVLAKADLTLAYVNAAGQTPTLTGTDLVGQILAPGAYNSASGTFELSGTVVLDGQNDPNAVFIFQTNTTLVTAAASNVSLIRGAQACNVFWQVGTAATLGANSTFRGTILAHDDISLGAGVTVDGRLLAGQQASGIGAVTLIGDTITRPSCAAPVATPTPTPDTTTTTTSDADTAETARLALAAEESASAERRATELAAIEASRAEAAAAAITAQAAADRRAAAAAERRAARRAAATRRQAAADRRDARTAARRADARRTAARERAERRRDARRAARIDTPRQASGRPGFTG